jgi:hypothetical protein
VLLPRVRCTQFLYSEVYTVFLDSFRSLVFSIRFVSFFVVVSRRVTLLDDLYIVFVHSFRSEAFRYSFSYTLRIILPWMRSLFFLEVYIDICISVSQYCFS